MRFQLRSLPEQSRVAVDQRDDLVMEFGHTIEPGSALNHLECLEAEFDSLKAVALMIFRRKNQAVVAFVISVGEHAVMHLFSFLGHFGNGPDH